jgi:hypothetical protein
MMKIIITPQADLRTTDYKMKAGKIQAKARNFVLVRLIVGTRGTRQQIEKLTNGLYFLMRFVVVHGRSPWTDW